MLIVANRKTKSFNNRMSEWISVLIIYFVIFTLFFPQLIGSAKVCYASEKSEVDPSKKIMFLKTINLTFCSHISVDEVLSYTPHPTDSNKTLLKQEASVSVHGVPLSHYMEDMITSRISVNAGKGRQGLEWVINKINLEVNDHHSILSTIFCTTIN